MRTRANAGFTLLELMITVAIVGILAMVAYPSYQQYIIRSNRASAQSEMMNLANRQQQWLLANRSYADATQLAYSVPSELSSRYSVTVTPDNTKTPPEFVITFTAIGAQATDGALTLNNFGVKTPSGKW